MKRQLVGLLFVGTAMSVLSILTFACTGGDDEEAVRNIAIEVAEACIMADSERLQQLTTSEFPGCPIFSLGFQISSVTVEGDTAVVDGRGFNAIGETWRITFTLVNQGGHWLVNTAE